MYKNHKHYSDKDYTDDIQDKVSEMLDQDISIFEFSQRTDKNLRLAGIHTIRGLVQLKHNDLKWLSNIGAKSRSEILEALHSVGLDICPDNMFVQDWITILHDNYGKPYTELNKGEELEKIRTQYKKTLTVDEKFDSLMDLYIIDLNLSLRTTNSLLRAGINNVGELVQYTTNKLKAIRYLGDVCLEEILNKLQELNLEVKPLDTNAEEWMIDLRKRYKKALCQDAQNDNAEYDIDEIPEKYRKYYAIGVQTVIEAEKAKQSTFDELMNRAYSKKMERLEQSSIYRIKVDDLSGGMRACDLIIENINDISFLPSEILVSRRLELIKLVLDNSDINNEEKIKLITFITDAKSEEMSK